MSIKKVFFAFLFMRVMYRSVRRYCFVRNYAAVQVQPEIVILQYVVCTYSMDCCLQSVQLLLPVSDV